MFRGIEFAEKRLNKNFTFIKLPSQVRVLMPVREYGHSGKHTYTGQSSLFSSRPTFGAANKQVLICIIGIPTSVYSVSIGRIASLNQKLRSLVCFLRQNLLTGPLFSTHGPPLCV